MFCVAPRRHLETARRRGGAARLRLNPVGIADPRMRCEGSVTGTRPARMSVQNHFSAYAAAVAERHCSMASARKARKVRRGAERHLLAAADGLALGRHSGALRSLDVGGNAAPMVSRRSGRARVPLRLRRRRPPIAADHLSSDRLPQGCAIELSSGHAVAYSFANGLGGPSRSSPPGLLPPSSRRSASASS
jgi:hypothetical protein